MKLNRKIRNLLINPKFQLKYIFFITFSGLVLVISLNSVFYYYIQENYKYLVDLSPMTDEAKAVLYAELHTLIKILSLFSVFFLGLVAVAGLYFSHRVTGAMYNIKRVIRQILDGNSGARVSLRSNDEFQDVAEAVNSLIDSFQKKGN